MEVNARLGGSLALALAAGVNFPEMLHNWKLGRTLAADVWNLKHVFRHQGQPDVPPRLGAAARFAVDFLRPNVGYGLERGDPRPLFGKVNSLICYEGVQWVRSRLHATV